MADNQQPNESTATQTDKPNPKPDPPAPTALNTVASKLQHAGGACLHLLACPSAAAPLLLTCICVAVAYKSRHRANDNQRNVGDETGSPSIRTVLQRSISLGVLHGGHVALQRIIDSQEARLNDEMLENAEAEFERLLNPSDGRVHFNLLQSAAGKLEMSGKEAAAVKMLKKALLKAKPHEAHEIGMLLVEMLIYKGDYDEALRMKFLSDEGISDARGPLYKAVIYSLKGDEVKAAENYRRFQEIQSLLHWPDAPKEETPLYDVVHDFGKFQTVVRNLKKEIDKVYGVHKH